MKESYSRFIEAFIPGDACNLHCQYCYVAQEKQRRNEICTFQFSPKVMGEALRKERLGGTAYVNICGAGETLMPKEVPEVINEILKQGHFVNVYTNGTLSSRFDELLDLVSPDLRKYLSISFSFHYLELVRKNLLQTFFCNFKKMKRAGCTVVVNLVLDDSYLPYVETIKQLSIENFGALPQISYPKKLQKNKNWESLTKAPAQASEIAETFDSPYWRFTEKYFNYDRKKFCYAGAWSFTLNLSTGWICRCYNHRPHQNIFENITTPIQYKAVGNVCFSPSCGGGLFLPQGVVPELKVPSYCALKDRPEAQWYNENFKNFLSQQLYRNNREYSELEKFGSNIASVVFEGRNTFLAILRKLGNLRHDRRTKREVGNVQ